MKLGGCLRFLGFAALFLMLPAFAAAQGSIKCESNDGHRNYCGNYDYNQITLDRQISGSPCVEGQTWGVDSHGLWVDRGCRAYFAVRSREERSSIKCESNDGHRNYCGDYGYSRVTLDRQISGSPCVEGRTWGVDGTGLWVDRGCRAFFAISSRRGGRWDNNDQSGIKCESNDGRRNYCGHYGFDQVRMDRQISGSPCIQGQTWGVDRDGLWVDRGCRAYFTIRSDRRDYGRDRDNDRDDDHGWWQRDPSDTWPPRGNWHGGSWEKGGACFYQDRDFGGAYFCLRRGEQRESLGGYGDDISSIRTFGGVRVTVFDDRNFSGARETLDREVSDLRQLSVRQKPGHTWNNRISSVAVQ